MLPASAERRSGGPGYFCASACIPPSPVLTQPFYPIWAKIATLVLITAAELLSHPYPARDNSRWRLLSWAEMFDTASIGEKKMIASYFIRAVTLARDYGIQVGFHVSVAQYLGGMEMG